MKLFLLSKKNLELSKEEVIALTTEEYKLIDNLLLLETNNIKELAKRLAFTKSIYELLFTANKKNLKDKIKAYDWNSIYKKDFCVRASELKESKLADLIWNKLKKPKANLENPKTEIVFIKKGDQIYATLLLKTLKNNFEKRKSHLRPEQSPTALDPRLARAIVNLTGAKEGETICDPFCGSGGILIEAGLIGLKPLGYDLYKLMLNKAKANLNHFKIKNYKLIQEDAIKIKERFQYIVTDVPYGLNTSIWTKQRNKTKKISITGKNKKESIKELEGFYLKFLKKIKAEKIIIIFPHYVKYKKFIKLSKYKITKEFSQFIHGSLTRKILILKKD